ncbi:acyltransferase domain-containing protein [Candidatus Sumerlaeota bacterium]|nr:acyltransferase domain-containing protein [Candidatus Sumerlaeota bacterium]
MNDARQVAIVGMGGVFPSLPNPSDGRPTDHLGRFWSDILARVGVSREAPPGRWLLDPSEAFDPEPGKPDKVYSPRACFLDDLPPLDLTDLDIRRELVERLDPLFRLCLHAGRAAFADAVTDRLDRRRVGVVLGNIALPTEESSALSREYLGRTFEEKILRGRNAPAGPVRRVDPLSRYVTALPAGVLARALGLGGGSLTLDAACASSLYAIRLAMEELLSGRADAMLAGGMSRPDSLYTQMGFSQLRALSPSGVCSPFDVKGDGLVVGEGAGILVLKRLADAVRDGDRIYAAIAGIGLSNDVGGALLAPMSEGQLRAMLSAYQRAAWEPDDVDFIECHATGTPVGDAVEIESLKTLWENCGPPSSKRCVIGAVKSNVGHLLTGAGAASVIKTLLALREKLLPPTANFERASPSLNLSASPFEVLTEPRPWETHGNAPRRAAVSAFGFGGINAHLLLEEWTGSSPRTSTAVSVDLQRPQAAQIAVVGMGARFGPWKSLRAFQERVLGGDTTATPKPACEAAEQRWWGVERSDWLASEGRDAESIQGFFLDELEIPSDRFRIPPVEIQETLPQQMLMLNVAADAIADSNLSKESRLNTGVFIGIGLDLNTNNYSFRWSIPDRAPAWARALELDLSPEEMREWTASLREAAGPPLTANRTMGSLGGVVASRIAREFHIGGPSFAVSSEDNSGLSALETAVRALQNGDLDHALVGAVDLSGDARAVLATDAVRRYSRSGRARPFDTAADGTLVGEGAAAVVLKRLDDAVRDGDRIYAIVKGIGAAGGGAGDGAVPDVETYRAALGRAYDDAGVDPDSIGYVETHGSGHPDEDRVESQALSGFFGQAKNARCLGSAKADVGHAGAASGLASFVKTCLVLYQEILPPLTGLQTPLSEISGPDDADEKRFLFPCAPQYWLRNRVEGPRRAAVSAFSIDGNCAHVVLEEHARTAESVETVERRQPLGRRAEALFVARGDDPPGLVRALEHLRALAQEPEASSADVESLARTWFRLSSETPATHHRALSLVARDREELLAEIDAAVRSLRETPDKRLGTTDPPTAEKTPSPSPSDRFRDRVFYSPKPLAKQGKIAFVFPGSGNHFVGMGRDLALEWPEVFRRQDARNLYLHDQFVPDLFWRNVPIERIDENLQAVIFGQVALGTAVSDLIRSFGVRPQAVVGYSLGESAGLFALEVWTDRDGMLRRVRESTLFTQDLAGPCNAARKAWKLPTNKAVDWVLGVIDRPAMDLRAALKNRKMVYNLIVNTVHETVIGGDRKAVEQLIKSLECQFFPLHGVTTVHCEVAQEVEKPYRELHLFDTNAPKDILFYSGAWGKSYEIGRESTADSVVAQAVKGIDFPKVVNAAYSDGVRLFLEMGPGRSCSRMIGEILEDRPHVARSACHSSSGIVGSVLRMIGQLAAEGVAVDLRSLYGDSAAVLDRPAEVLRDRPRASRTLRLALGGAPFTVPEPRRQTRIETPDESPSTPEPRRVVEPAPPLVPVAARSAASVSSQRPVGVAVGATGLESLVAQMEAGEKARLQAHEVFLRFSDDMVRTMQENIAFQISVLERMQGGTAFAPAPSTPGPRRIEEHERDAHAARAFLDRDQCMEFAVGSIARVLGPEFAPVDAHPTRVRLPDEPLMLVDRIVEVEGEPRSMTHGRVVTEHDVLPGAWYLDGGRIATCIAVEAGQADLFLSGYLGIDFETQGLAVYRLLDAAVTFHRALPRAGSTIRYDIRIERFFRQGDTYLFRFNFDGTVDGEPLLSMRDGCAGFFTAEDLAAGRGIVESGLDRRPQRGIRPSDWKPLVAMTRETYSEAQLDALRAGDFAAGFGPLFANLGMRNPLRIPGGRMHLVDRVVELDPEGGRFGIGRIRAEADIHPGDWFLTCHFVDDQVMPGTLMYECCLHTLRIFLLRMGWIAEDDGRAVFEPVPGIASRLKCRGQVIESTRTVAYDVSLKEVGFRPEPYAIANATMYADGKPIVDIGDMTVRLSGVTREDLERLWSGAAIDPVHPPYDYDRLLEFTNGLPSAAYGEAYRPFDDGSRFIARLPRTPYQFLDRIVRVEGEPFVLKAGARTVAEYDVPPEEWYFRANNQEAMPYAVLLEVALQSCGWTSAYVGSALAYDAPLHYRNLGGEVTQYEAVAPNVGTLRTVARLTDVSKTGGMIIQYFDFEVRASDRLVMSGKTYFGFFSDEALAGQVGIREARPYEPSPDETARGRSFDYPDSPPFPGRALVPKTPDPRLDQTVRMAGGDLRGTAGHLRMVDRIDLFVPDGGAHGLGFIRGSKKVDPAEWLFRAHFFQDPVCPGSLGLESFLQLLKVVAVERWDGGPDPRFETTAPGEKHTWVYRGQILPTAGTMGVEANVTELDDAHRMVRADGWVLADGLPIYQLKDFTLKAG